MPGFAARLLTGALLFVLLAEWLRPLSDIPDITGIVRVEPLILVLAGLIGVDVLRLPAALGWTFKSLMILSLPAAYHGSGSLLDGGWWSGLLSMLAGDAGDLLRLRWHLVSPELRTLLFVYAWAVLAALLFSAVYLRRFGLWFTGATLAYLLAAEWWMGREAFAASLRVALAGLLLHVLHVPPAMQRRHGAARLAAGQPARWAPVSLSLAAVLVGGSALAAHWAEPRLARALDLQAVFAWSWSGWDGWAAFPAAENAAASGYGGDDGRLGRPLKLNHEPAFLAVSSHGGRYWRGEAKLEYTGRGWEKGAGALSGADGAASGAASAWQISGEQRNPPDAPEWHLVYWLDDALTGMDRWPLFATDWPEEVRLFGGAPEAAAPVLEMEEAAGNVHLLRPPAGAAGFFVRRAGGGPQPAGDGGPDGPAREDGASGSGRRFASVRTADSAGFSESAAATGFAGLSGSAASESAGMSAFTGTPGAAGQRDLYLQLPATLPERVRELAHRIAEPYDEPHDKARAIERFLKEHYTYSLDTAPPKDGSDFVDHFLFETGSGYCDHFSTAMAVLLRAAGIPARWVKGFLPGEPVTEEQAMRLLEEAGLNGRLLPEPGEGRPAFSLVRNSDAHSWVEAWLPDAGWVAFEPTPGTAGGAASFGEPAREAMARVYEPAGDRTEPPGRRVLRAAEAVRELAAMAVSGEGMRGRTGPLAAAAALLACAVALWRLGRKKMAKGRSVGKAAVTERLGIACRLGLYRLGLYRPGRGPSAADAVLLERMLKYRLAFCLTERGDTLREAAGRAAALAPDPAAGEALDRAVRLYERLRYGPARGERLPPATLWRLWRELAKGRRAPGR